MSLSYDMSITRAFPCCPSQWLRFRF